MKVARQLSILLSSTCIMLSTTTAQAVPPPSQTDLRDRDLQTLKKVEVVRVYITYLNAK
jgi:hypothetical protein